jgi:hypothetical protein
VILERRQLQRHNTRKFGFSEGLATRYGPDGFLTVDILEGSCNMEDFERLVRQMEPFPEKNSVLVMDNCRIHKSGFMPNILRVLGIRVHFSFPVLSRF